MAASATAAKDGTLQQAWSRVPPWLRPYILALSSQFALVGIAYALRQNFGVHVPAVVNTVISLLYLLVMLGSAWLGYGPGILVATLTLVVLPRLMPPRRGGARAFDPIVLGLVLLVSILISRIAQTRRRREAELVREAEELERRVRQRTAEALRAAGLARETEERLEFLLHAAEIGHWEYDFATGDGSRSLKHDQIFGHRELLPEWNYRTFIAHIHPDDRPGVESRFEEIFAGGAAALECRIIHPDGATHWVWLHGRAHPGPDGKPARATGVISDISGPKRIEESLRDQARLLDLAHDAILSLDLDGTIRFWSRGAEELYGWRRDEVFGKNVHDLLKTVFPEDKPEIVRKADERGYWEGELRHTRKDGAAVIVNSRWAVRRDSTRRVIGFLEINTDITEKRHIEEQLRHTQKLESLGVLAGGVAHDFNNLLTGILGNASLALDGLGPNHPYRAMIEEVMTAAERAADLTRQLLAYAGKGRFVMRTVNLSELVREISGLIQTSIPKQVQLRLQLDDGIKGIDADPGQLQQIVMNLVINAAEAIGPEGGGVLVTTRRQQVDEQYLATVSAAGGSLKIGEYICLEVHDTGSGMSDETLRKIFDPFFTTKFTGRGLGLSAVLGIVNAHHGALKVYSQVGQGTTFKVLFPASTNAATNEPATFTGSLTGSGTVLIVDDEDIVRQTAKNTLERYGYTVVTARDGAAAVDLYRRRPDEIALVLLDLTMPVMGGEEALRRMQTLNPRVAVLLSSGYNEVEAVQRFAGKGLAGFIQKPYTAAALAEKVKQVLSGKQVA